MLRLIGWMFKVTLFSILVLILGNWIKWNGRTVSDQVRVHLSHAERAAPELPHAIQEKLQDKIDAVQRWSESNGVSEVEESGAKYTHAQSSPGAKKKQKTASSEEIPPTERQKLRALIRELNSSRSIEN